MIDGQHFKNWARKDSNLGPMDYESTALPLSYGPPTSL